MTTVVGYARAGAVAIASDTAMSLGNRPILGSKKLFRLGAGSSEVLLGFCGAGAGGTLLRKGWPDLGLSAPSKTDAASLQDFAEDVAIAVTKLYVDAGIVEDGRMDGNLLLAFRGGLWTVSHHQAMFHEDGMASIGTGDDLALGALIAMLKLKGYSDTAPIEDLVRISCESAIEFDSFSGGTVDVEVLAS